MNFLAKLMMQLKKATAAGIRQLSNILIRLRSLANLISLISPQYPRMLKTRQ